MSTSKEYSANEPEAKNSRLIDFSDPVEAGPSISPLAPDAPPPFEAEDRGTPGHVLVDFGERFLAGVDTDSEDPPPDFAPYVAEFYETSSGDIISHDRHLNEDGEIHLVARAQVPTLTFVWAR